MRNAMLRNYLKERIVGRDKNKGAGWEGVIMSASTSTQIPNQKASKKTDISREQHSKQAEKLRFCRPGFHNFSYIYEPNFKVLLVEIEKSSETLIIVKILSADYRLVEVALTMKYLFKALIVR